MSLSTEIDADNVVELDPGSAAFKANAHRYMAEWARRSPFYMVGPGQRPQPVYGGAVGELRLQSLPMRIQ